MPFLFIIFFIKLAFIFVGFIIMAFIGAEFLPDLADLAVSETAGTGIEELGVWVGKGINFLADLCRRFLDFMFMILEKVGLDTSELQEQLDDVDTDQIKSDVKNEAEKF